MSITLYPKSEIKIQVNAPTTRPKLDTFEVAYSYSSMIHPAYAVYNEVAEKTIIRPAAGEQYVRVIWKIKKQGQASVKHIDSVFCKTGISSVFNINY